MQETIPEKQGKDQAGTAVAAGRASGVRRVLDELLAGRCSAQEAEERLRRWFMDDLGFACLDHHRQERTGRPEVVYGENKTGEQIAAIVERMRQAGTEPVLVTRVSPSKAAVVQRRVGEAVYHEQGRVLVAGELPAARAERGCVGILAAGTSDLPVAEEARITASFLGNRVEMAVDVGVSGLHRLAKAMPLLEKANVLIVVAGMEGALPSVVAGLATQPVIAVPTSVGYGTGLGGVAALLAMLNSCAPGVAVVNIDNGFGAACVASSINRLAEGRGSGDG